MIQFNTFVGNLKPGSQTTRRAAQTPRESLILEAIGPQVAMLQMNTPRSVRGSSQAICHQPRRARNHTPAL